MKRSEAWLEIEHKSELKSSWELFSQYDPSMSVDRLEPIVEKLNEELDGEFRLVYVRVETTREVIDA